MRGSLGLLVLLAGCSLRAADSSGHWAFQPVRKAEPPATRAAAAFPIDKFVIAKLEAAGASLAPTADPRTLIRRAYFDLTGLPPTADEVDEFTKAYAAAPQPAYEKLIDKLLASPRFGEAQARHWLDLARYADTKGYVFTEDRNYPYAYTYRDWVIRAFNDDMPYDRFIMLQVAADRMTADNGDLAAMGFLTLGRRFLNNIHDIIDDRLDVTSRTFLGLTLACARCHDHKYDPIPAGDYYSLYGVFASSVEPKDLPMIGEVKRTPEVEAFEAELKKKEEGKRALFDQILAKYTDKLKKPETIAAYLIAVRKVGGKPGDQVQAYVRERDLKALVLNRWRAFLTEHGKKHSPEFEPFKVLAALPDDGFESKAAEALKKLAAVKGKPLNPQVMAALSEKPLKSFDQVAEIYGKILSAEPGIAQAGGPLDIKGEEAEKQLFLRDDQNKLWDLQKKIDAFKAGSPAAPPRAMVLNDAPNPTNPYVFLRGNPGNRGPAVPRQFLQVLSGPKREPFHQGSGRLELAKAIADPSNPLTARVMVNRVWITLFGKGLVRTPSDFGVRCDPPTHPELLDYLAATFVENGWSVKKLYREVMRSRIYQQSAEFRISDFGLGTSNPKSEEVRSPKLDDPENRLLGHQNRRRLEFEQMRDAMLQTAGTLDLTTGGKAVDLFKEPFSKRRSVYGFIDRQNLPGTLRVFDFASPDQHSPQRFTTTVPQQALFLMNSPFLIEQAKRVLERPEFSATDKPAERVQKLYRVAYARSATPDEVNLAVAFVDQGGKWEQLVQVLLIGNEFCFID